MSKLTKILATALFALALTAAPAQAEFGLKDLAIEITDAEGKPAMQAGSHPFAFTTNLAVNEVEGLTNVPDGQVRNLRIELPTGLAGSPTVTPRCEGVDFATLVSPTSGLQLPSCSDSSVIGLASVEGALPGKARAFVGAPVYNLVPPPGVAAKFGFVPIGADPVTIEVEIEETFPYDIVAKVSNITQVARFFSAETTIWGNPSDSAHDKERGKCGAFFKEPPFINASLGGECPTSNPNRPFLTLPRECTGQPLSTLFEAESWLGDLFSDSAQSALPVGGCEKLGFDPKFSALPTSQSAESPSGLDFDLEIDDQGLTDPNGLALSDIKKVEVALPEGVTANPSQAEGLAACSEVQLTQETADSAFGKGCPAASKIGSLEAETPLLEGEILHGSVFIAEPFENRFGTLLALFMTVKHPELGISVKVAGKVEPDPQSGQLITTFEELPQQPLSHVHVHLREGGRSPLITPPTCGTYETEVAFTPYANPANPLIDSAPFEITSGVGGGPCPSGGQPFEPGFLAAAENNAAGEFSPFNLRLTRRDGDQDLTRFAAKLPSGLLGKLAGVSECSNAQIARARAKSGKAEQSFPSCPANSQIGTVLAGAGVGSQLIYVPGKVYLAGPYKGAPLSVVGIVPAVAGPFDVGNVVSRQALQVDPRSGEVRVDDAASDPIPHILAGIPLRVRDIRVSADRPNFTLNPTSCDPTSTVAQIWGGGANPFSTADDAPVTRDSRFQAAGCERLAFKPRVSLKLKGGTDRGDFPALRVVFRPRPEDANTSRLALRFPRSAFIEQSHFRTICTRVQFAADNCPKGAIYGQARGWTPLLDQPLEGPVYLRSSDNPLPDVVLDLHGRVDFEAVTRIDSVKGGLRATAIDIPDAPVTKVVVNMQGGKKGLFVNSRDLCASKNRATVKLDAHNGKRRTLRPVVKPTGC